MLCQYNNIYAGSYKYLKEKKKYKWKTNKKKKNAVATVATVPLEQTKVVLYQLFKTWGKKRLTTPKGAL